jgi:hypothetical protein
MFVMLRSQHIAIAFAPRGVVYLNDDGFDTGIRGIIAVIEAGGVETESEISQVGQQADGSLRPGPDSLCDKIANRLIEVSARVSEVIPSSEISHVGLFIGPQGMNSKDGLDFGQIEIDEKQAILKVIRSGLVTAMADGPLVDTAFHHSSIGAGY